MSVNLWAFDDIKCDGYPCPKDCDICELKDEHRCYECKYFEKIPWSVYGTCLIDECGVSSVRKSCEDFEEAEE